MEPRFGKANRVWVMDRGMVSARERGLAQRDRAALRDRHRARGTAAAGPDRLARRSDWRQIREDVRGEDLPRPRWAVETFLLCRSASRLEKEKAMHARFASRIEAGLACARPTHRVQSAETRSQRARTPDRTLARA